MSMKVLVADSINEKGVSILETGADVTVQTDITPEQLIKAIPDYNAIVIRSRTKMTKEVIEAAKNLKIIARAGVGVDNVDLNAATEHGIMVINSPTSTSITVAEQTLGLILSLARKINLADKSVKENKWEKKKFMGIELRDKVIGVIGMGRIGSQVISRCKAFGMTGLVYDPYLPAEVAEDMGVKLTSIDEVLEESDFISIHVPLTDETHHLISTEEFKKMKETGYIINCARGGIIDEEALYTALKEDIIAGAALDVYENEPLKDSKLMELDNIILTPHIAASTKEAQRDAAIIVANEIVSVFNGEGAKNVLNMPVVDGESFQKIKPYMDLCQKIGTFLVQNVTDTITSVEVISAGKINEIATKGILTRKILQGILTPMLNEPVNMISVPVIAKQRGIKIVEGETDETSGYRSLIKATVKTSKGEFSVEGTSLHGTRFVGINGYWVDFVPEKYMFLAKYEDIPGSIGSIGSILGEGEINIGIMQVGRDTKSGTALMILTLDNPVTQDLVDKILELENIHDARAISF